jgi:hypothetical protein
LPTPVSSSPPAPPSRAEVVAAIATASERTGVDFDYLLGQARIESGLNPLARARTSSATGLFQFTQQTWLATVKADGPEHGYQWAADAITQNANGRYRITDPALRSAVLGLRNDPLAASSMAAEFAEDNAAFVTARTGQTPESVDLYLAHFLGAAGAAKFLSAYASDAEAAAAPLFPAAAAANRGVFYNKDGSARTLADIRSRFAAKLEQADAGLPPQPANLAAASGIIPAAMPHTRSSEPQTLSPTAFRGFEPMPKRLSLDFAAQAYRRLAALDGGRA